MAESRYTSTDSHLLLQCSSQLLLADRQEHSQLGFTYVQGMNVLAAPFLYTMPSELEAFYCFSKFIEESCPLYVQPTLEGVHRGLKVSPFVFLESGLTIGSSFSTGVLKSLIQSSTRIYVPRTSPRRFMPFLVSAYVLWSLLSLIKATPSRPDSLCLHTSAPTSVAVVGFSPRIRRSLERSLCYRTAASYSR